jgi:hypothetical protein
VFSLTDENEEEGENEELLDDEFSKFSEPIPSTSSNNEINKYVLFPLKTTDYDTKSAIKFFINNYEALPVLSKVAIRFLSIMPCNVSPDINIESCEYDEDIYNFLFIKSNKKIVFKINNCFSFN